MPKEPNKLQEIQDELALKQAEVLIAHGRGEMTISADVAKKIWGVLGNEQLGFMKLAHARHEKDIRDENRTGVTPEQIKRLAFARATDQVYGKFLREDTKARFSTATLTTLNAALKTKIQGENLAGHPELQVLNRWYWLLGTDAQPLMEKALSRPDAKTLVSARRAHQEAEKMKGQLSKSSDYFTGTAFDNLLSELRSFDSILSTTVDIRQKPSISPKKTVDQPQNIHTDNAQPDSVADAQDNQDNVPRPRELQGLPQVKGLLTGQVEGNQDNVPRPRELQGLPQVKGLLTGQVEGNQAIVKAEIPGQVDKFKLAENNEDPEIIDAEIVDEGHHGAETIPPSEVIDADVLDEEGTAQTAPSKEEFTLKNVRIAFTIRQFETEVKDLEERKNRKNVNGEYLEQPEVREWLSERITGLNQAIILLQSAKETAKKLKASLATFIETTTEAMKLGVESGVLKFEITDEKGNPIDPVSNLKKISTNLAAINVDDPQFEATQLENIQKNLEVYFSQINQLGEQEIKDLFDQVQVKLEERAKQTKEQLDDLERRDKENTELTDTQATKKFISEYLQQSGKFSTLGAKGAKREADKIASLILADELAQLSTRTSYEDLAKLGSTDLTVAMREFGQRKINGRLLQMAYKEGDTVVQPLKDVSEEDIDSWSSIEKSFETGKLDINKGFFVLVGIEEVQGRDSIAYHRLREKLINLIAEKKVKGAAGRMDEAAVRDIVEQAFEEQYKSVKNVAQEYLSKFDKEGDTILQSRSLLLKARLEKLREEYRGKDSEAAQRAYKKAFGDIFDEAKKFGILEDVFGKFALNTPGKILGNARDKTLQALMEDSPELLMAAFQAKQKVGDVASGLIAKVSNSKAGQKIGGAFSWLAENFNTGSDSEKPVAATSDISGNTLLAEYWNSPEALWLHNLGADARDVAIAGAKEFGKRTGRLALKGLWGSTKVATGLGFQAALTPFRLAKYPLLLLAKPINLFRKNTIPSIRETAKKDAQRVLGYTKEKGKGVLTGSWEAAKTEAKRELPKMEAVRRYKPEAQKEKIENLTELAAMPNVEVFTSPYIEFDKYSEMIAKLDKKEDESKSA